MTVLSGIYDLMDKTIKMIAAVDQTLLLFL